MEWCAGSNPSRASHNLVSDWSPWLWFVISVLATWRVAHLMAREDGPFQVIVKLRVRAGDGFFGKLMDCPYCLSLWIAVPFAFALANTVGSWIAVWLAISGGASILENALERLSD